MPHQGVNNRYKLFFYFLPIIIVLGLPPKLDAQNIPSWALKTPKSNYYIYAVGTSYGANKKDIKRKALIDAISQLSLKQEVTVQGVQELNSLTIENDDQLKSIDSLTNSVTVKYDDTSIKNLEVIDEYITQDKKTAHVLVRFKKANALNARKNESLRIKTERKKAVSKAFLFPGYGHRYMGYETKGKLWGYSFGAATILGGIGYVTSIYFENQAASENQINRKNYFNQVSQKFHYSSLALFGIAGALYVTNIIAAKIKAKRFLGNTATIATSLSLDNNHSKFYSAKIKSKVCPQINIQVSF